MLLTCPRCSATYLLDDALVQQGNPVQCTQCQRVWRPEPLYPAAMFDAIAADPDNPAPWQVLDDWLLEHGEGAPQMLQGDGFTFFGENRSGFVTRGSMASNARPPFSELREFLRSQKLAVMTELRLGVLSDGAHPATIPSFLDTILLNTPPRLLRLEVWATAGDCRTLLEPLTRLRPNQLTELVLRTPARGLQETLERIYARGWNTITVKAPYQGLAAPALRHRVQLRVIADRDAALVAAPPGLQFIEDPLTAMLALDEQAAKWLITPGADGWPQGLTAALASLGLELHEFLGKWRLLPLGGPFHTEINDEVVTKPLSLRGGVYRIVTSTGPMNDGAGMFGLFRNTLRFKPRARTASQAQPD